MIQLVTHIDTFRFSKKDKPFFEKIFFTLKGKEINFLIGMSGIGKTTLLKIILGILNTNINSQVSFIVDDISYSCLQAQKLGLIGFISQTPSLIPWETIKTNIEIPRKLNSKLTHPSDEEIRQQLNSVGLDGSVLKLYPHQISFGMQSRISIIRMLLYKPKFLFLDELFTGIDTINSNLIATKLKIYVKENDVVCLSVSHDIERAINIATNIFLLNRRQFMQQIELPFSQEKIIEIINTD